jgi:hypothetical protein
LGVKILKFFDANSGSVMEKIRIRDKHPGSATLEISGLPELPATLPSCVENTDPDRYGSLFLRVAG